MQSHAQKKFISGLVLGAGESRRLGQPKQLLPYKGTTLLGWVLAQAEAANSLDEIVVVLGGSANSVRQKIGAVDATIVENIEYTQGCSSSYKAGIAALDPRADAVVIILGDQPDIEPEVIDRLVDHWREHGGPIALCSYQGRKGHPMLFSRNLFGQLTGLHGDKAAWRLVDANSESLTLVEIGSAFPEDIDTWEDYQRVLSRSGRETG